MEKLTQEELRFFKKSYREVMEAEGFEEKRTEKAIALLQALATDTLKFNKEDAETLGSTFFKDKDVGIFLKGRVDLWLSKCSDPRAPKIHAYLSSILVSETSET